MSLLANLLHKPVTRPPKKEFPSDEASIDAILYKMAPEYLTDTAYLVKGVRGKQFRYNNNSRGMHGWVKVVDEKVPLLNPIRDSKPIYTFPHTVGKDFESAPDGVYTWVLYENDGVIRFVATRIENKMELGGGHEYTLVKLGIKKEFKVPFAGELKKEGNTLSINLASGSYMERYIRRVSGTYNIDSVTVNRLLLARALNLLRSTLPEFTVSFAMGANEKRPTSLIDPTTTPLTYESMKELTNVGAAKFHFISNTNLEGRGIDPMEKDKIKYNMPNWRPFLPPDASVGGGGTVGGATGGGSVVGGTGTLRKRKHRRSKMTRKSRR